MRTDGRWQPAGAFTARDVEAHLRQRVRSHVVVGRPERLEEGLLNVVWRVPAEPQSLIVKHAPPYIASAPEVPLDPSRLLFEARALQALDVSGRLGTVPTAQVRAPRCVDVDPGRSVVVMEDIGPVPHLGSRLSDAAASGDLGAKLGTFVGRLHRVSQGDAQVAERFRNVPVQETRRVVQYEAVGALLRDAGLRDASALGQRAADLGQRLLAPGRCLIHGDLWPRSVLVRSGSLRLIDWEFAHYGSPAQDLGHLAAHLWMMEQRASTPAVGAARRRCWDQAAEAYRRALGGAVAELLTEAVVRDAAIHAGAEVLVRAVGAFRSGYLYDGADDAAVADAVGAAAAWLRQPAAAAPVQALYPR